MVFSESLLFSEKVYDIIDDDEYATLQGFLAAHPDSGVVIRGSGGIRKARWAAKGKGKRGGARVIYFWRVSESQILMIDIYTKGEKEDVSTQEIELFQQLVKDFVSNE
jgi:hypothetical protein